tara:strand:+ start:513 stop:1049 length:537 start_codon:yes stop_codon:yes gene_type:complete
MKNINIDGLNFEILIPQKTITKRIFEISQQLKNKYQNDWPLFIIVLNGAVVFANQLLSFLGPSMKSISIKAHSYNGLKSTGKISIENIPHNVIKSKSILIIEDIVDSGLTFDFLRNELLKNGALSVECVTLLFKKSNFKYNQQPKYIGFHIGKEFVVGYGMDYNQYGRDLENIYKQVK